MGVTGGSLDGWIKSHRRLVLGVWALLLVVALPLAASQTKHLSGGGFNNQSSDSAAVARAIESGRFHGASPDPLAIVLLPRAHSNPRLLKDAIHSVARRVRTVAGAHISAEAINSALETVGEVLPPAVIMEVGFHGGEESSIDLATRLRSRLGIAGSKAGTASGGSVAVHVAGQGAFWAAFRTLADNSAKQAEMRGFPLIALVLLLVFGSVAAALLPLSLGVLAVVITGAVIYVLSLLTLMSVFVTNIASMIGIGVAVDYSLFVLVRYREEVAAGHSRDQARAIAMRTSGRAVVLAGSTVIISLTALFLIPSTGIRSMAVGAIVVVAIAVLSASTLLPALIGLLGARADQPGRIGKLLGRLRPHRPAAPGHAFWSRWSMAVMRRPVLSLLAAVTVLLALAAPALDLKVRNSAENQLDRGNEVTQVAHAVAKLAGAGAIGPTWVLLSFARHTSTERNHEVAGQIASIMANNHGVQAVDDLKWSSSSDSALLTVTLHSDPESVAARSVVERLRRTLPSTLGAAGRVQVGGTTAELLDFDRLVTSSLWQPILFVLAMSFLALVVLLRSIVLPLKAMLMNALSVAAAYGSLVAVFQFGWLGFLGLHKSPSIYPITLPLVLVVAFGLSMDYHVFLLSRIRERYLETEDNTEAVAQALASSATPITSAALIMIVVFLSFVGAGVPSVKQLGFAAAVAIGVDATLVRLVVVPAAMKLLGRWNWWLPQAIEHRLPARPWPAPSKRSAQPAQAERAQPLKASG